MFWVNFLQTEKRQNYREYRRGWPHFRETKFPEFSRFLLRKFNIPWVFPEILTIFQIPWVFQVFHAFHVCGHPEVRESLKCLCAWQHQTNFEHLEIKLLRFSYLSIKSWKFETLKHTMIGFKLEPKKTTLKRYQKSEFQTLKDTTSTPTILPYKNPTGSILSLRIQMTLYLSN